MVVDASGVMVVVSIIELSVGIGCEGCAGLGEVFLLLASRDFLVFVAILSPLLWDLLWSGRYLILS